jgi:hypothetical protein
MFALTTLLTAPPPRDAATDIRSFDRAEVPAPRARRARLVGRWICPPDSQKPICLWRIDQPKRESRRSRGRRRAA